MPARPRLWLRLLASGSASALCYGFLFANEREVMAAFTRTDGWYPVLPVLTAFVFSLVHGAFTSYFWDAVGIVARPAGRQAASPEAG